MNTFLPILVFLLVVAAIALRFKSRSSKREGQADQLEPSTAAGSHSLFTEEYERGAILLARAEAASRAKDERERLLERAGEGDEKALDDAFATGKRELYHEVLQKLVEEADSDRERLRSIAEYIVGSGGLRSSADFAGLMLGHWKDSHDQPSPADLLYLAALSDEAPLFEQAVEETLKRWRAGELPQISATDLIAVVESAYWLIADETRYSGSGFLIKQAIADVRRELAAGTRRLT